LIPIAEARAVEQRRLVDVGPGERIAICVPPEVDAELQPLWRS
jgi:hypothetical protein